MVKLNIRYALPVSKHFFEKNYEGRTTEDPFTKMEVAKLIAAFLVDLLIWILIAIFVIFVVIPVAFVVIVTLLIILLIISVLFLLSCIICLVSLIISLPWLIIFCPCICCACVGGLLTEMADKH